MAIPWTKQLTKKPKIQKNWIAWNTVLRHLNSKREREAIKILKKIPGFDDYFISDVGEVYSIKSGTLYKMHPFFDSKHRYKIIKLSKNHKTYAKLVHRLVAEAFIPNPNHLPEVNHKDKNPANNCVNNLNWCTRQENLTESYSTMSPVRNFHKCQLFYNGELIDSFQSVSLACRVASEKFGVSYSSLRKYGISEQVQM